MNFDNTPPETIAVLFIIGVAVLAWTIVFVGCAIQDWWDHRQWKRRLRPGRNTYRRRW